MDIDISAEAAEYMLCRVPRPERYPESVFLEEVVPTDALRYLRSLEFSFLWFDTWPLTTIFEEGAEDSAEAEHRD